MNIRFLARRVRAFALVVALVPLGSGACLVTADSQSHRSGNYVADSTFDQIQPGKTTSAWVKAIIGSPSSISTLEDGTEVWKYTYTERKESSGSVFLLFGGHSANEVDHTAFVQIKNGFVSKAWRG